MKQTWLRWTVPPSISLLVHAVLVGVVAWIGMQISANQAPAERVIVTELALPAPPSVPDSQKQEQQDPDAQPLPERALPSAPQLPDLVETQASTLERAPRSAAAPTMDPVTLEAMRETSATIARPESTSPPSVAFAGVQSKAARTLVYVVDGSGATANSFAYLQTQLMRSIDRLSPTQRFQVVLFRELDNTPFTLAPINNDRLARATPEHKQQVSEWLDTVTARGKSNPLDGLKEALALKPDLVLFITRSIQRTEQGWAQGQREILQTLNELNPQNEISGQRKTVIKCVQLLDEDPTGIMRAIGSLHGDGSEDYQVVRYEDLISNDQTEMIAQRSIGASDEQRITSAAQMWSELAQVGTIQSVLTSVADDDQRMSIIDTARAVRTLVGNLRAQDGRADLLWAQATIALHRADGLPHPKPELQSIIDRLASTMYTDPATDTQRSITVAHTRAALGQAAQAGEELRELLSLADELGLDRLTRAQVLLALVAVGDEPEELSSIASEPPFTTPSGNIDALWGLLLREGVTIGRLKRSEPGAWTPMLRVRQAARQNESIVSYIDQRLALIFDAYGSARSNPPIEVLMAAGDALSRSIDTRERAMSLLRIVADAEPGDHTPDVLWQIGVLGRAINTPESIEQSNESLTRLALEFSADRRALGAISSAIGASSSDQPELLRSRLEIAISRFPQSPAINLWRLQLGELLSGFARLDLLDTIEPETREGVLAGELYEQTVLGMLDKFDDTQVRLGLERRMQFAATKFGLASAEMWTRRGVISQSLNDPENALASIESLIADAESRNESSDELRMLRAQTLLRMGQTQTAFASLRELSARIDASSNYTSTYWQSWTLMLESVAQHGSDVDKAEARRHLARLSLIDPQLGSSPWRERLQSVGETLHSEP